MQKVKKIIKIIAICLSIPLLLDFIPIKRAISIGESIPLMLFDATKYGIYMCYPTESTEGFWEIVKGSVENSKVSAFVDLTSGPMEQLNDYFFVRGDGLPADNVYIFRGQPTVRMHYPLSYDLEVEHWDIVFPIRRESIRGIYAPKSYLTIYDYDWEYLAKKWFNVGE